MSISTKTGDKGKTSLWSGERITKDHIRVEAYGTLDELDAHLSEAKLLVQNIELVDILETIQKTLKLLMGELASVQKKFPNTIKEYDVINLSNLVNKYEKNVILNGFVVSRKTLSAAKLDICRTVSRRAERRIVSLSSIDYVSEHILAYMNRLSDLLFIMARIEE